MNQTESGKLYSNEQVALLLSRYFPIPIYPVLGNNDGNPAEEFDFLDSYWLTSPLSALYQTALGPEAMESFRLTGSYSQLHRNSSLRIVTINTQACKNINFYLIRNITDPGAQITFLQSQLALAESQGERVFILGHIPPGAEDCMSDWADRYNAVVGRYAGIVAGQFFGHTHSDQFYVGKDYRTGEPATVQWVAPSVTTLSDRNPSYRVYEVDSGDHEILDYHQYRLDLPLANAQNITTWTDIYSFKDLYSLPNLNITSISALVQQLSTNSSLARLYLDNYNAGGPGSPAGCSGGCLAALNCTVTSPVWRDYLTCTNSTMSKMNQLMETLQGPWVDLVSNQ
jgi:sphingomyelin phosphodiesterase